MNDRFLPPRRGVFAAILAMGALLDSSARAQEPAPAPRITEAEVVQTAMLNNPGLKASVLELQDAQWALIGEEGRYPFILQIDGGLTRRADPSERLERNPVGELTPDAPALPPIGVRRVNESYAVDLGTELRKHLVWGTDLSLRLSGSWGIAEANDLEIARMAFTDPTDEPDYLGAPSYGLQLRFSVVQPLLRGAGRDIGEAELLTARLRRTSAEHARDRAASELLRNVTNAYWELWYTNAALGIQEQSRALATKQRDDAAARAKSGSLAPAEVFPFETRVATREEDVLGAQVEAQRQQTELAEQAGILGKQAALGLPAESVPPTPPPPPADVERAALAQSPQLRELEASLELARVQARTAGDSQRARLDLDAYVQADGVGYDDAAAPVAQVGKLGAVTAGVGLTFETPLDDSRRRADAARARLAVEIAVQRLEQAKQGLRSEVRIALAREAAARRKLELAEETARIAARQLAAEQARFEGGSSTSLPVLEAEDTLRSAQLRVARARADVLTTNLAIQHLTGRLLDDYAKLLGRVAPRTGARRGRSTALAPRVGAF